MTIIEYGDEIAKTLQEIQPLGNILCNLDGHLELGTTDGKQFVSLHSYELVSTRSISNTCSHNNVDTFTTDRYIRKHHNKQKIALTNQK